MALIDTEERLSLVDALEQFVANESPLSRVREVAFGDESYDARTWQTLAGEIGIAGLLIAEEHGGAQATAADLVAVARELGAGLVPSPLLAAVMASTLLTSLDDDVAAEWLPRIAVGDAVVALAVGEQDAREWISRDPATKAVQDGGVWRLTGVKSAVVNGAAADAIVVIANAGDGIGAFLVPAGSRGLAAEPVPGLDRTRALATLRLDGVEAVRIAGDVVAALDDVETITSIFIAAEEVGGIGSCLDMTVEYAKVRYSFGLPIGAYQGVKHKLADMYTDWSLADAAVRAAAEAWDAGADRARLAAVARVIASPAYVRAAQNAMLLHGGIGFTWEHDAHLFYKNAMSDNVLFGGPAYQRRRLASLLGS